MNWRTLGVKEKPDIRFHHIDFPEVNTSLRVPSGLTQGSAQAPVAVEMHFRPMFCDSPLRNWRLQRWFKEQRDVAVRQIEVDGHTFCVPSVGFDVVYQLMHIFRHLFIEGIGLRQLLDYYFVLRSLHVEQGTLADSGQSMGMWAESIGRSVPSNVEVMHTLSRFGMKKFAGAVMWVMKEVFAMPEVYMLCEPNERLGRHLLNEIMIAGNFGKYDQRVSASSAESRLGSLRRRHAQTSLLLALPIGSLLRTALPRCAVCVEAEEGVFVIKAYDSKLSSVSYHYSVRSFAH